MPSISKDVAVEQEAGPPLEPCPGPWMGEASEYAHASLEIPCAVLTLCTTL
jgi:hypothetical protein